MSIYVKRFSVKHNGKIYGPGETIRGISSDEAKKLAEDSHGTLIIVENAVKETKSGIPPVNPSKTVKGTKK